MISELRAAELDAKFAREALFDLPTDTDALIRARAMKRSSDATVRFARAFAKHLKDRRPDHATAVYP